MTGKRHRCSPTTSEAMPTAGTRWVCASMPWDELIARHRHTAARRSRGGAYSHTVHRAPSRRALVCSVPTLPSSARRSAATTDTTRGAIHDGAGGGGVMKRAWYVCHRPVDALAIRSCGTALSATALPRCWMVYPHQPSSSHHAAPQSVPAGETARRLGRALSSLRVSGSPSPHAFAGK